MAKARMGGNQQGNQLGQILAALGSGNVYTGQRAFGGVNDPRGFNLGSAIGAAYAGINPLRQMNASVSVGRNQGVAQIRSAQAAADAQKFASRQQTEQAAIKASALSALLGQFMNSYQAGAPSMNLRAFTTDYGAGIGR